jgi:hypothetical protein
LRCIADLIGSCGSFSLPPVCCLYLKCPLRTLSILSSGSCRKPSHHFSVVSPVSIVNRLCSGGGRRPPQVQLFSKTIRQLIPAGLRRLNPARPSKRWDSVCYFQYFRFSAFQLLLPRVASPLITPFHQQFSQRRHRFQFFPS